MRRLAIYAHFDAASSVARHVLYHLEQLRELGFQICFVSNSEITVGDQQRLGRLCEKIIVRENTGLDFGMWKRALLEQDLLPLDELLLTNSSIVGPLQPIAPLWQNPVLADCDFWGLTDNAIPALHLQSYFLVFRRQVIQSPRFIEFWHSVLPYRDKVQLIWSYEVGLTRWLMESGFKWQAIFPQKTIWPQALEQRSLARKIYHRLRQRDVSANDISLFAHELLLQSGMPYLKASLLKKNWLQVPPQKTFDLLMQYPLPAEAMEEIRLSVQQQPAD